GIENGLVFRAHALQTFAKFLQLCLAGTELRFEPSYLALCLTECVPGFGSRSDARLDILFRPAQINEASFHWPAEEGEKLRCLSSYDRQLLLAVRLNRQQLPNVLLTTWGVLAVADLEAKLVRIRPPAHRVRHAVDLKLNCHDALMRHQRLSDQLVSPRLKVR